MKVIKKINNNFAIALDRNLEELIIYGRGVGFPTMPYELNDLSRIDRTYYNVDMKNIAFFDSISEEIIVIASDIVDACRGQLESLLNANMVFTLSDHIAFCIERLKKGIYIQYPMVYDLKQNYSKEMKIACDAVKWINYRLHTNIPLEEAAGIAINIINNEINPQKQNVFTDADKIIEHITKIVENTFNIVIEQESASYARYATHVQYLLQRLEKGQKLETGNITLLETMKKEYPKEYAAAVTIIRYLESKLNKNIHKEELVYLMLHINRVCSREICQ